MNRAQCWYLLPCKGLPNPLKVFVSGCHLLIIHSKIQLHLFSGIKEQKSRTLRCLLLSFYSLSYSAKLSNSWPWSQYFFSELNDDVEDKIRTSCPEDTQWEVSQFKGVSWQSAGLLLDWLTLSTLFCCPQAKTWTATHVYSHTHICTQTDTLCSVWLVSFCPRCDSGQKTHCDKIKLCVLAY